MSAEEPTNAPAAAGEEESTATFEPVVRLSETVEVKTHEEDEEALFKMLVSSSCFSLRALARVEGPPCMGERQGDRPPSMGCLCPRAGAPCEATSYSRRLAYPGGTLLRPWSARQRARVPATRPSLEMIALAAR